MQLFNVPKDSEEVIIRRLLRRLERHFSQLSKEIAVNKAASIRENVKSAEGKSDSRYAQPVSVHVQPAVPVAPPSLPKTSPKEERFSHSQISNSTPPLEPLAAKKQTPDPVLPPVAKSLSDEKQRKVEDALKKAQINRNPQPSNARPQPHSHPAAASGLFSEMPQAPATKTPQNVTRTPQSKAAAVGPDSAIDSLMFEHRNSRKSRIFNISPAFLVIMVFIILVATAFYFLTNSNSFSY